MRAAGGLVVRDGLVLLVHRPRYDDWTFPKGKAEPGEAAALLTYAHDLPLLEELV